MTARDAAKVIDHVSLETLAVLRAASEGVSLETYLPFKGRINSAVSGARYLEWLDSAGKITNTGIIIAEMSSISLLPRCTCDLWPNAHETILSVQALMAQWVEE